MPQNGIEQYGIQGSGDPHNPLPNLGFTSSDLQREAGQIVAEAFHDNVSSLPKLWVPFGGNAVAGTPRLFQMDVMPEWWVIYVLGLPSSQGTMIIGQGSSGQTGRFPIGTNYTIQQRFAFPGRDRVLYCLAASLDCFVVAHGIRGYPPSYF